MRSAIGSPWSGQPGARPPVSAPEGLLGPSEPPPGPSRGERCDVIASRCSARAKAAAVSAPARSCRRVTATHTGAGRGRGGWARHPVGVVAAARQCETAAAPLDAASNPAPFPATRAPAMRAIAALRFRLGSARLGRAWRGGRMLLRRERSGGVHCARGERADPRGLARVVLAVGGLGRPLDRYSIGVERGWGRSAGRERTCRWRARAAAAAVRSASSSSWAARRTATALHRTAASQRRAPHVRASEHTSHALAGRRARAGRIASALPPSRSARRPVWRWRRNLALAPRVPRRHLSSTPPQARPRPCCRRRASSEINQPFRGSRESKFGGRG